MTSRTSHNTAINPHRYRDIGDPSISVCGNRNDNEPRPTIVMTMKTPYTQNSYRIIGVTFARFDLQSSTDGAMKLAIRIAKCSSPPI